MIQCNIYNMKDSYYNITIKLLELNKLPHLCFKTHVLRNFIYNIFFRCNHYLTKYINEKFFLN